MPDSQVHGEVTCLKATGFCYFFTLDVKKLRLGVWLGLRALAHPHHDEHAGRFRCPGPSPHRFTRGRLCFLCFHSDRSQLYECMSELLSSVQARGLGSCQRCPAAVSVQQLARKLN